MKSGIFHPLANTRLSPDVPDRLSLSPQCGFASCAIGNKLTVDEQWAKLRLVKEISDEVWGSNS